MTAGYLLGRSHRRVLAVAAVIAAVVLVPSVLASPHAKAAQGGVNDPSCRPSTAHPSPVVLLHGLGANANEDLNVLQGQLAQQGYCTFAVTYGADPRSGGYVGGVRPIAESAPEIAAFVERVLAETGAPTVDIVGHSEGAFQSLYVTKTQGIAAHIGRVVAIAPPTHGTTFGGMTTLATLFGSTSRQSTKTLLDSFGCYACDDLIVGGAAVQTLNSGPIAQPGVTYTVIASQHDEMVTPTETAFVHEPGVTNEYVQNVCPLDPVGHLGEAYDSSVWQLVEKALDPAHAKPIACSFGFPA